MSPKLKLILSQIGMWLAVACGTLLASASVLGLPEMAIVIIKIVAVLSIVLAGKTALDLLAAHGIHIDDLIGKNQTTKKEEEKKDKNKVIYISDDHEQKIADNISK